MGGPRTASFASNGRHRLSWQERGNGSPLLLVMGHTYSSAMWYPAVDVLAGEHRVLTFDNRGTGRSSTARRISVEEMAHDAFAVLDAADVPAAHVYGVSMGGGIALEMARQQPARVRSLLLGCTMAKTPDVPGLPLLLRPLLHLPAPVLYRLLRAKAAPAAPHSYGTRASAQDVQTDLAAIAADVGSIATSVAQTRAIQRYAIPTAAVRALQMPALVLHGDEDATVPYDAGVRLHELIAHSELVTLGGAGHNYFIAGHREANAAALEFLRRTDQAGEQTPALSSTS